MITFRLTAEEYEKCREICYEQGIRSVSGMVRSAINLLIQQPDRANPQMLEDRVSDLEIRLHILLLEFKRLNGGSVSQPASKAQTVNSSSRGNESA